MRCKKAEQLIIDSTETDLAPKIKNELAVHITSCQKCLDFREEFYEIRTGLNKIQMPKPSGKLLEKTKEHCHIELIKLGESYVRGRMLVVPVTTPRWILVALVGLFILTIVASLPILRVFISYQSISSYLIIVAIVLFQNIITLFFIPIIFRLKALKHISEHPILNGI
jgi:hypothetical protein